LLHVLRGQLDQVLDPGSLRHLRHRRVPSGQLGPRVDEEDRFDAGECRGQGRRPGEIADRHIHAIAEALPGLPGVARENARALAALEQTLDDAAPDVACGASDEVLHEWSPMGSALQMVVLRCSTTQKEIPARCGAVSSRPGGGYDRAETGLLDQDRELLTSCRGAV
jgi:hypothetical protein